MKYALYLLGGVFVGSLAGELTYKYFAHRASKHYGVKLN